MKKLLVILTFLFPMFSFSNSLKYLGDSFKNIETFWSPELQGLCHDEDFFYVTQRDYIWKFPRSLRLENIKGENKAFFPRMGIPLELRIQGADHMGDCDVHEGNIYIPLEGTKLPRVLILSSKDLSFIDAPEIWTGQQHAPWVTVDSSDGSLILGTFDLSKKDSFFKMIYNKKDQSLELVEEIQLTDSKERPLSIERIQGVELSQDHEMIWVVSDHKKGGLYGFNSKDYKLVVKKEIDYSPGFPVYAELEGIDILEDNESFENYEGNIFIPILNNNLIKDDFASLQSFKYFPSR